MLATAAAAITMAMEEVEGSFMILFLWIIDADASVHFLFCFCFCQERLIATRMDMELLRQRVAPTRIKMLSFGGVIQLGSCGLSTIEANSHASLERSSLVSVVMRHKEFCESCLLFANWFP